MEVIVPPYVDKAGDGTQGLFSYMHYSVDKNGPNHSVRQSRLTKIFNTDFKVNPGAPNANYINEFGEPSSKKRFDKMERFLDSNSQRYKNMNTPAWLDCLYKWAEDYNWLVKEFGPQFGYELDE